MNPNAPSVGDSFSNLLSNAVNVLGTDGMAVATQDMTGNGYAVPYMMGSNGMGYYGSSGGGIGTLLIIGLVALFLLEK